MQPSQIKPPQIAACTDPLLLQLLSLVNAQQISGLNQQEDSREPGSAAVHGA